MKNILLPTDFSICAKNATYAALELAATYGATLHLYHVIAHSKNLSIFAEEDEIKYPELAQKVHNAKLLMKEWEEIAKEKNAKIKTSWSAGNLVTSINQYTENHPIDFLVMGSHGASGKNEFFIGSNTQKVVRAVHTPVLVIKEKLKSYRIDKVVFASNFNTSEKTAFQYLLDFVKHFKPEIHLLQINTGSWFDAPYTLTKEAMNDFKEMCGDLTCKLHFYRDWTIDAGIRHLSEEIGANLIAISNQKRHPLKRIFAGSNVEALVNHSQIPVLSIDLGDES